MRHGIFSAALFFSSLIASGAYAEQGQAPTFLSMAKLPGHSGPIALQPNNNDTRFFSLHQKNNPLSHAAASRGTAHAPAIVPPAPAKPMVNVRAKPAISAGAFPAMNNLPTAKPVTLSDESARQILSIFPTAD